MCRANSNDGKGVNEINRKYRITLENTNYITDLKNKYRTKQVPKHLYEDLEFPDLDKIYSQYLWRLDQISYWFEEFGKDYFKDLNIWHLSSIKNL